MALTGYSGRVLRIDLEQKKTDTEELDAQDCKKYLGSRGLGALLFSRTVKPGADPLSRSNPIVFITGPLTGSNFLSTPKHAAITKSPLTGFYTESLASGKLGLNLKSHEYDGIVVTGKAEGSTYISLAEKGVDFHDARSLWGKSTSETISILKQKFGPGTEILCIGPAGENLVPLACVFSGRRTLGRGGVGAVMGSKGLKAIVVTRGRERIEFFDKKEFNRISRAHVEKQRELGVSNSKLAKIGSSYLLAIMNELGILPTRNFQSGTFGKALEISGEALRERHMVGERSCSRCMIPCEKTSITRGDDYQGVRVRGPEYETLFALGAQCGNGNLDTIIMCARICDDMGLDTISTGVSLGFAMELFERNIITERDLDGIKLSFGNGTAMIDTIMKIALGHGIGKILGKGVKKAAQEIGTATERCAMHVKGMELPGYDPRGAVGMGLGYATSPRGACHLKAWTINKEVIEQPETRFLYDGKAEMVKSMQDYRTAIDCSGLCMNATAGLDANSLSSLIQAVTGFDLSESVLTELGERVWNLERMLGVSEGISRKDDALPARFFEEPLPDGNARGHPMNRQGFERMLSEYYELRGWDVETGVPHTKKLHRLDLSDLHCK